MTQEKEDKEREGLEYEPEEVDWPEIKERDFIVSEENYVICMDTIGQDREFTQEEIDFTLKTIFDFKENWTETEKENLKSDITRKMENTT